MRSAVFVVPMFAVLLLAALSGRAAPPVPTRTVQFNRDIRPILSDNCFYCHGPDKNHRQAGLRLDQAASALAKKAIVPGKPDQSTLIARIATKDDDALRMPPSSTHKTLTTKQKALLRAWIAEGAVYQPHWAYIPPQRPVVPRIADPGIRNPIDAFIRARLAMQKIKPSPEADKRTLIRRVSLDLTGLPPTPAEVRAFLADRSPNAYETVVDRLLASPRYGERMAVPWLDAVRYADTVGFHGDQNQNAWPYRDYVIDAFNKNKPFDRFTIEQIAGDLLPNPTAEQLTATAFNRLNMMTREGGSQPKEYLAKYTADRVRTVSMSFLGSTMGCAECHDHKFDPFTARDFYAMGAFFADVKQWGVYADYGYTPNPDLRGYNNDYPFPPEVDVESPYLTQRIANLRRQIDGVVAETRTTLPADAFAEWTRTAADLLATHPDGWEPMPDDATTLNLGVRTIGAIRIELLPVNGSIFRRGMNAGTLTMTVKQGAKTIAFRHAEANLSEPRYANGFEIIGVQRGWRLASKLASRTHESIWYPSRPIRLAPGETLSVALPNSPAARVRISVSPFGSDDRLDTPQSALRAFLYGTGWNDDAWKRVSALEAEILACRDGRTPVLVTEALENPMTMRVLARGNWQDETSPIVTPAVPGFLQKSAVPNRRLNRLDLARWIVSKENPLTARVIVNRLWRQFYGNGLSGLVEDLGAQGEWPTHPELLDWLAVEFRDGGWDVKHLVRLMVTSATYRQSSSLRPELRDIDPNNRLLASQNPRRLEAEFVRDNALAIAGLLNDREIGGPPVKPYQPPGYYVNIQFPNRDYDTSMDDRQYRRGVYMHWQRTFLHPMLANFDAPSREDAVCTRTVANTPQQALTLLNDPTFLEAARVFAGRLLSVRSIDDGARLDRAFEQALGRPIKAKERESLLTFLATMRTEYGQRPDDAKKLLTTHGMAENPAFLDPIELAAWTSVCRVVLNLNETITRY